MKIQKAGQVICSSLARTPSYANFSQPSLSAQMFPKIRSLFFWKGSVTLEAAASLPFFLLFCAALMSFLVLVHLQNHVQISMEEAARSMGKTAYLIEQVQEGWGGSTQGLDGETVTLLSAGINPSTMKAWILQKGSLARKLQQSRVLGKAGGLYTFASSYDEESGILDLVTQYDYAVPWLPPWIGTLRMVQRMYCHVWIGKSLQESGSGAGEQQGSTVYVTPTGSVYHQSASCHYLDLSIHGISYGELGSRRNADGAKYYPCEECAAAGNYDTVYITNYGTSWHTSLSCSGLKRTVIETELSETEGLRPCSKCSGGSGH